jgi:hypothetical protein
MVCPMPAAGSVINSNGLLKSTHDEVSDKLSGNHPVRGRNFPDSQGFVSRSTS